MSKVNISMFGNRRYKHSHRITNSTTSNFGGIQPVFSRILLPNSSIKGSLSQFVRLAPMPWPTFGDLRLRNIAVSVPIEQVYPAFAAFVSGKEYSSSTNTYFPASLPYTNNDYLCRELLTQYSTSVAYVGYLNGAPLPFDPSKDLGQLQPMLLEQYYDFYKIERQKLSEKPTDVLYHIYGDEPDDVKIEYTVPNIDILERVYKDEITLETARALLGWPSTNLNAATPSEIVTAMDSADYVDISLSSSGSLNGATVRCYRYTKDGCALRKVLLGLGYNPNLLDYCHLSLLPLLAYGKAVFDSFYPRRLGDFSSTNVSKCVRYIETNNINAFSTDNGVFPNAAFQDYVRPVLRWIVDNVYASKVDDILSIAQSTINNGQEPFGTGGNQLSVDGIVPSYTPNSTVAQPRQMIASDKSGQSTGSTVSLLNGSQFLSMWSLQFLSRVQKYINKDSLIGNRLELWMQSHLGSDVYNNYFRNSKTVASNFVPISISDVDSQAYTSDAELGSYAGKGVGKGNLTFDYSAKTYEFFFILSYIEPETGWYQGTDQRLLSLSRTSLPLPEFDALGYESLNRSVVYTKNEISGSSLLYGQQSISNSDGFGFVPRYSSWKYAKNIVNGDMSRHSMRNTYKPFYLDRDITVLSYSSDGTKVQLKSTLLPIASTAWQYVGGQDWLTNYNRIFYNSGTDTLSPSEDNFILHNLLDFTEFNALKPLSLSYDTDVNGSQSDTEVTAV